MKIFILTEEHIKLVKKFCIDWNDWEDFGAPMVNPKRPYGNSSVLEDIHIILTGENLYNDEKELTDEQCEKYEKLHKETKTALQIILKTGKFKTGTYICKNDYDDNWELNK